MTLGDLVGLLWSRKLVATLCLAMTGLALFLVSSPVQAWNGRVSVVLLVPRGTPGNPLASTTRSLISTTGIVARDVEGPTEAPQTVSSDLNLSSVEATPGWTLRQPSVGGQWDINYEEPRLDVKSWGPTREQASAQMAQALSAIDRSLTALQDDQGVDQSQRIRVTLSPEQPVFTTQAGSRVRALAATGVVGMLTTLAAVVVADRMARARRRDAELVQIGSEQPELVDAGR